MRNRFHEGHYKGLRTLLKWCVEKYKTSNSPIGKRLWRENVTFLARIQKEQFYSDKQKKELNKIRDRYNVENKIESFAIGGKHNPINISSKGMGSIIKNGNNPQLK